MQNRPLKAKEVRDKIYGIECITGPFFNVFNQVESDNDKLSEIAAAQLYVLTEISYILFCQLIYIVNC